MPVFRLTMLLFICALGFAGETKAHGKDGSDSGRRNPDGKSAPQKKQKNQKRPEEQKIESEEQKRTPGGKEASRDDNEPVIKAVSDNKVKFSSTDFPDIAAGQIFIVQDRTLQTTAARLEVTQVSKDRKLALAKIIQISPALKADNLLGLRVVRSAKSITESGESSVSLLVSPPEIARRNNSAGAFLTILNHTPSSPNVLTGFDLNQSLNALGADLEFFIPTSEQDNLMNRFGLIATFQQDLPVAILGRTSTGAAGQSINITTRTMGYSFVFRGRTDPNSMSQYWFSGGYSTLTTQALVDLGNTKTDLQLKQTGPIFSLGGDFSPLPFFYLGFDLIGAIPQKYSASDNTGGSLKSGSASMVRPSVYGELRYPVGSSKASLFIFQFKAGNSFENVEIQADNGKNKSRFSMPSISLKLGFSAG